MLIFCSLVFNFPCNISILTSPVKMEGLENRPDASPCRVLIFLSLKDNPLSATLHIYHSPCFLWND